MSTLHYFIIWFYRLSACIVTVECIKRFNYQNIFNIKWNNMLINLAYRTIYVYSKLQLLCIKIKKNIFATLFIINNTTSIILQKKYSVQSNLEFYNFGNLIESRHNYKNASMTTKETIENCYKVNINFIMYSDLSNLQNDKKINKVRYEDVPAYFCYEVSNIKFIALIIFYENKDIPIELSSCDYNYYIVGNIIDKPFIMYFIKNILKDNSIGNSSLFKYKLTLYDHNANINQLDESQSIVIYKDDYSIKYNEPPLDLILS